MIPEGYKYQSALGGRPHDTPQWIYSALRGTGAQQVKVVDVDYVGSRVSVENSNGTRWAWVLKSKASKTSAGSIDMPNIGDIGLVVGTNGDEKSPVWLGALTSVEPVNSLQKDSNFTTADDLVHRSYWKHETGSFRLLDKLGNFAASLFKRAATEADTATKNLELKVLKDGTISLTQYKTDGVALALTINISADGSATIENDGHQITMLGTPGAEIFRYKHKKKDVTAQVTEIGDVSLNVAGSAFAMEIASGDVSMNHKSGSYVAVESDAIEVGTQDGSTILLGKDQAQVALSTGQSIVFDNNGDVVELTAGSANIDCDTVQLGSNPVQQPLMTSGFYLSWNTLRLLLASHTHTSAAPGVETSPSIQLAATLIIPDVPVAGGTITSQTSAG